MVGVFDQAARYASQAEPEAVLGRVLRGLGAALRFREWVESRTTPLPGERDRTADRVAALLDESNPQQPWLLLLEFQAEHDPDKLDITLAEVARLRTEVRLGPDRKGKYKVLGVLVYLRGECPDAELDMRVGGRGSWHGPPVWNVAKDEASVALDDLAAGRTTWGVLFWIALMHRGGDPAIIARWKELARALPDARQRGDLGRIALVFAELAGCYLAWERALEDWTMTESQVVNRWIEKAQTEARLEQARAYLVRIVQKRFPGAITPEVVEAINSQPSRPLLDEWLDAAATAGSFQDFLAVVRR